MENNMVDVVQLFITMATPLFGSQQASIIGPYLLIIFSASTGAGWALSRRQSQGKIRAFFYFLRIVFTAILLTIVTVKVAANSITSLNIDIDWLIGPMALMIGLIGDDWLKIFAWLMDAGKKAANQLLRRKIPE